MTGEMPIELTITDGLDEADEDLILTQLKAHNVATYGESGRQNLAVPLHDADGNVIGGLTGYTARGWLHIAMLYIPDALRRQGLAARMLELAETEARARGCIGSYLDTMNPDALSLYIRCGYSEIGRLQGLSGGHAIHWLEKRF